MKSALALVLLLSSASPLLSQQPSNTPTVQSKGGGYSLKVTSTIVVLDVVVTDAKGNPVDDLKRSEFHITEDKAPQTIRSFDPPQVHFFPPEVNVGSTAELDKKAPDAPVSIIVLDELNTKFEDEAFTRYSIQRYLKTQPEHLTQPTELIAVDLKHLQVLRDYTTSKQEILNALNHHLAEYPWRISGSWAAERFSQAFLTLSQVAKAVAGHPGHKNMIWIGHGLPTVNLDNLDPQDLQILNDAIDASTNQLRDARVTLYTVDPSGISTDQPAVDDSGLPDDSVADPFESSVDFNAMAKATGGVALYGRNDVDNLIGQSVRDGSNFYTLSYKPLGNTNPKAFHGIRVTVDRPGLIATTREGYYVQPKDAPPVVKTEKAEEMEMGTDLLAASQTTLVYDGLPMTVTRDPKSADRFIIHIDSAGVEWDNEDAAASTAKLSLVVASFDAKGKLVHRDAKVMKIKRPVGDDPQAQPSLNIGTTVNTAKPVTRLRFVVRSTTTGKMGAQNLYCTAGDCVMR